MTDLGLGKIAYGGDWNPEQWDSEIWQEDVRLFKEAGIDLLSINIFAWTLDQPNEDTYTFEWLDEIFDLLHKNGMKVCLGTGTAAHPAWMATKYPDILRTDFQGRKRKYGDRHNSCPSSPTYARFAPRLAKELAQRYKDHPALSLWHISNEFGGACYCENCEKKFRVWLRERYGTLEALNAAWNTRFWSQTITDWDEIVVPNVLTVQWGERNTAVQGLTLDFARFNSDNILDAYSLEHDAIREVIPDATITTNFMDAYRPLNYRQWAKKMDIIAWDSYPRPTTPPSRTAMMHDIMRGLKDGQPFMLMEQTPSQTNWQPYNALKRPGVMRLQSYQAVAHGADAVMFFQMRRSRGASEKFHGAVIEHSGRSDTRVFREVSELGAELQKVGDLIPGSRIQSEVALYFDWENWWAAENSMGPGNSLDYVAEVHKYYHALYSAGYSVDLVGPETDLSGYKLFLAPVMYLLHPGQAEKIAAFVESGGTFLTGMFSGFADQSDLIFRGGPPGPLTDLLGLWIEETDAQQPETQNKMVFGSAFGRVSGTFNCSHLFDLLRSDGLNTEPAEVMAIYGTEFYAGTPALTRKKTGQGEAWYMAASPDPALLAVLIPQLCENSGIEPMLQHVPAGVEVSVREQGGTQILFLLNHTGAEQQVELSGTYQDALKGGEVTGLHTLPPHGVSVLKK